MTDAAGAVVHAAGDIDLSFCPRSALKPVQALPLMDSGAADAFDVTTEELALATASHNGEPDHVRIVAGWLSRLGLSEDDLACGSHPPMHDPSAEALYRTDNRVSPLHNNCSGKHAGFLTVAKHLSAPLEGYLQPDHPVQVLVRESMQSLLPEETALAAPVTDGCSAPNYFISLKAFASALARFPERPGAPRILNAMNAHPHLVAGTGRACSVFIPALKGQGIAKVGAEGVYGAVLPDKGWGIVLKIDDGARRAAEAALAALLIKLDVVRRDHSAMVSSLAHTEVKSVIGRPVGVIRAST